MKSLNTSIYHYNLVNEVDLAKVIELAPHDNQQNIHLKKLIGF
jgi:hypothetical protein